MCGGFLSSWALSESSSSILSLTALALFLTWFAKPPLPALRSFLYSSASLAKSSAEPRVLNPCGVGKAWEDDAASDWPLPSCKADGLRQGVGV